jgi:hypothetical protein
MATQKNLVILAGLSVGSTEIINSSGKLQATAISELTTDNLSEGSTNTYYSDSAVGTFLAGGTSKTIDNATINGGTY